MIINLEYLKVYFECNRGKVNVCKLWCLNKTIFDRGYINKNDIFETIYKLSSFHIRVFFYSDQSIISLNGEDWQFWRGNHHRKQVIVGL